MKITSVKIENFMAIGSAEIALDNKGLWLVQGENRDDSSQDSNGAGKSSVVDAICWALYGKTARGQTGDAVINRIAGKNCRVSVTVEDETTSGDAYTITRHRKHKSGKSALWVHDNSISGAELTKGTDKLTQEVVEKILGCSYEVFRAAIYMGQEDQTDLPGMTDKQLKQIVEEAAGVDRIEEAYDAAKAKKREVEGRISKETWRVETLAMEVPSVKDEITLAEKKAEEWQEENEAQIAGLKRKAKTMSDAIKKAMADLNEKGSADDIQTVIDNLDAQILGVSDEQKELTEKQNAVNAATNFVQQTKTDYNKSLDKIKVIKAQLENLESTVGTPCGECGKPYEEHDLDDRRESLKATIGSEAAEARRIKAEHEKAQGQLDAANEALDAFKAGMTDISSVSESIKAERKKLAEINAESAAIDSKRAEVKALVEKIKDKAAQENPHQLVADNLNQKLVELENEERDVHAAIKKVEAELNVAKAVCEVFSPAGVRAHIIDTVTPFLNTRTAEYLSLLSDGNLSAVWNTLSTTAKGEVREKFHIAVTSATGGDTFEALSGGEKRKVRLSCVMALQDLVASRASKPINLFIGDEIDHALDVSGLERLMGVLEIKARERGTVLVISHNELSDWIRDHITVVKEGGVAKLEGGLCHVV